MTTLPRPGELLTITVAASVQFHHPIRFAVISVSDSETGYDGWAWLDGYEINAAGDAVDRRSIFVQLDGLGRIPRQRQATP